MEEGYSTDTERSLRNLRSRQWKFKRSVFGLLRSLVASFVDVSATKPQDYLAKKLYESGLEPSLEAAERQMKYLIGKTMKLAGDGLFPGDPFLEFTEVNNRRGQKRVRVTYGDFGQG